MNIILTKIFNKNWIQNISNPLKTEINLSYTYIISFLTQKEYRPCVLETLPG